MDTREPPREIRITKLHLLVFLTVAGSALLVYNFWRTKEQERREAEERRTQAAMVLEQQSVAPKPAENPERKIGTEPAAIPTTSPTPAALPAPASATGVVTYTVQKGDTLWGIAKRKEHFGQGHRWYDIWKANEEKIDDFDHLVSGLVLEIPLDKPDGTVWPRTSEERKRRILEGGRPPRAKKGKSVPAAAESPPTN